MDDPSSQLFHDLQVSVTRSLAKHRPILHHLNSDTSWLLQLPRPSSSVKRSNRHWFNILIDPWLSGSQSDVASWFSQQWHASAPAVGSIQELEGLAKRMEMIAEKRGNPGHTYKIINGVTGGTEADTSLIDAIAVSHEFTDHCHKDTLLDCHSDIPVFATAKAAQLIRGWGHFRSVYETPAFAGEGADWRTVSLPPLPDWLAIGRLVNLQDALYYHSALIFAFDCKDMPQKKWSARYSMEDIQNENWDADVAEAIIYTPHGIHYPSLEVIPQARPPVQTLALLHGLHDITISRQQLNMGAHNGLQAQRLLKAPWWLGTHDEVKNGSGLVSWFLRRKVIALEEALALEAEHEKSKPGSEADDARSSIADDVHFKDLGNGESIVLLKR